MKSLGHSVTIVGYQRPGRSEIDWKEAVTVGRRHIETKYAGWHAILWALSALLRQLPYSSAKYYSTQYIRCVKRLLSERHYHAVILEHSSQLGWLEPALAGYAKPIVLAHNLEHEIFLERIKETSNPLLRWMYQREACLTKKIENHLAAVSAGVWTLTQYDADYFARLGKAAPVKAFGLPSSATQPIDPFTRKTFDVGMIGNWFWKPNGDGLRWFFEQVYPYLPKSVSIEVAGRGAEWLKDKYPNVIYRGFVDDARVFLSHARIIAIPSTRGGGIQIKTLESIGLGLPIVATPFALRGIADFPTTVRAVEAPDEFANCLQVAIAQPISADDLDSVQQWVHDRRSKFLHDIETFLTSL